MSKHINRLRASTNTLYVDRTTGSTCPTVPDYCEIVRSIEKRKCKEKEMAAMKGSVKDQQELHSTRDGIPLNSGSMVPGNNWVSMWL